MVLLVDAEQSRLLEEATQLYVKDPEPPETVVEKTTVEPTEIDVTDGVGVEIVGKE